MSMHRYSRRDSLKALVAGASVSAASLGGYAGAQENKAAAAKPATEPLPQHERRMQWWREAKFGMFIHWGLYSQLGRGEWVLAMEDMPLAEYEPLAKTFRPRPNAIRDWARLARQAGMKYMVMTTKHHEGFCLFNTKTTDYCATRQGPGRDLVREYVEAARSEGLRVGFYYSLMDWHHPDWMKCKTDAAARQRMVEFAHAQVQELMTNYGKIDILWYDMAYPLDGAGWQSRELNRKVLEWQPDIVVNNRSGVPGDFATPEQNTQASKGDWESCMTLNDNWGYNLTDHNWKTPVAVLNNLIKCSQDGGNYLLDIGPKADGSLPEPCTTILQSVGEWMQRNGSAIYGTRKCWVNLVNGALFTRKDNTIHVCINAWPGTTLIIGGIDKKTKSAKLAVSGRSVEATVKGSQLILSSLPAQPPDKPIAVIALEFDSAPIQNSLANRIVYDVLGGGPES
ncbi:MAG TPA: alpha-L-fucosidase [Acidobacteriota bacterium]|nr:alpha-L-fucosidase [Acidobacteriota bacterium]